MNEKFAESQIKDHFHKKIAFVVQRYGLEVNGGAEYHCRLIAERMAKYFDVDVITTCAIDYMTWKNEYIAGVEELNGLKVRRFPVDFPRDVYEFNKFSAKIFGEKHTETDEIEWMKLQGPYSSTLFEYIKKNNDKYDYFIFFTYLYCTTFFGLPFVKDKAILVPTAHDEPPIYLSIFNSFFKLPQAIIYNTEEEKKFLNSKFKNQNIMSDIIGVGIDIPKNINTVEFKEKYNLQNFILYIGRIDESKGCKQLFDYFLKFRHETKSEIKLVLLGNPVMKIPENPNIVCLGFVSEQDKYNALNSSHLLLMPSKYESLSMVLLEAWHCKKPVLVNGQCEVLKGQCRRSNAGLWYENYEEFSACLNLLLTDGHLRELLGNNGRKFVDMYYSWEIIEKKYLNLIERLGNHKS
ncbi:MAG: glycosyltransferase family 4 protein [Methanomethylovorans sp.]|jgi:glycosyltransferase involved in cell wall biosynthesis|nr:glycosyltransferase family 4 protein [Methanomethylovorans sp.]